MVVCEQHEHCPYMNMMFKMVIVSMKMFVMIKVPIDMIMVLKIGIEQIEPCPYLIVMIVSKMMLVMIITVLKMMMLVMIKGVGECRLVAKSKHRHPALTILTSQIIRCLFTMLTRGFISLSFLNSTSAYLGTWPISEKMRGQCDLCEDTFLSASFLNYHMSKQHKESCELGQCKDTFYQANFAIPCHHQQKNSRLNKQINLLQELLDPRW